MSSKSHRMVAAVKRGSTLRDFVAEACAVCWRTSPHPSANDWARATPRVASEV